MNKYFLYHRVSKQVQATDGQGIDRQIEVTKTWIENHNKSLISSGKSSYIYGKTYEDRGKSGYTKANIEQGELGRLLKDVENGFIKAGDIVVIELIDRFSRASPDFVRSYFQKILESGVKVAITKWDLVFEEGMEGIAGVSARVLLELGLFLAHQESSVKSQRIIASTKIMKENGLKVHAKTPIWLNRTKDRSGFEVVEKNAELIRTIFRLKHKGYGAKRRAMMISGVWKEEGVAV